MELHEKEETFCIDILQVTEIEKCNSETIAVKLKGSITS